MPYDFVNVNQFTPNIRVSWTPVGRVDRSTRTGSNVRIDLAAPGTAVEVSFLGPECFLVRFRPATNPDYTTKRSAAGVTPRASTSRPPAGSSWCTS